MHELSIALSIIECAEEEASRQGAVRVDAVHLKLGPLAGVAKEALLFSYSLACEGTSLEGSELIIEDAPLVIFCDRCAARRNLKSPQTLVCPECGAPAAEVLEGRELAIAALEISDLENSPLEMQT